jgi:GDP-L-fucose synthase
MHYSLANKRIFVAGHRGTVGAAVVRVLNARGNCEVVTANRSELDLRDQLAVARWMEKARPDAVILAAAKVGGIIANRDFPVDFLYDNVLIQNAVMGAANTVEAARLVFLGSTCIYPRDASQPLHESSLLTGPLEPTNEWYAVAKIAGIKLCQAMRRQYGRDYISVMPTNLYGPGDNYHPEHSHMAAGLIRRIHEAKLKNSKEVVMWGTGTPRRELMHADDCASAIVFLLENYSGDDIINIGQGEDHSINDIAQVIASVVGWEGTFVHDLAKPDGTPRKLVAVDRLFGMGWRPKFGLRDGLQDTYKWFCEHQADARH